MKILLVLTLVGLSLTACNFGRSSNPNKNAKETANVAASAKDRFVGNWVPLDREFGPITFKSDGTYEARHSNNPNSSAITGTFEIRNERLYCKGELEKETSDGFKLEGDRISLRSRGETVYFRKG